VAPWPSSNDAQSTSTVPLLNLAKELELEGGDEVLQLRGGSAGERVLELGGGSSEGGAVARGRGGVPELGDGSGAGATARGSATVLVPRLGR
jgi:hypothetical protein